VLNARETMTEHRMFLFYLLQLQTYRQIMPAEKKQILHASGNRKHNT